jgi:hypothetical protein
MALCHYRNKQYAPALNDIATIIERGIRDHSEQVHRVFIIHPFLLTSSHPPVLSVSKVHICPRLLRAGLHRSLSHLLSLKCFRRFLSQFTLSKGLSVDVCLNVLPTWVAVPHAPVLACCGGALRTVQG